MPSITTMSSDVRIHPLRIPARARIRRTAPLGAAFCLALLLAGGAGAAPQPVRARELLTGLEVRIQADGSLEIIPDAPSDAPVLTARLVGSEILRRVRTPGGDADAAARPYLGRAAEGCPGGHRGFSTRADDDGDGQVDEDPLDGLDNDGDGRVDEDFAAVSDAMIAITGAADAGGGRIEYYQWGHARLQGTVFATVAGGEGSRWLLTSGGSPWFDVNLRATCHSVTGRPVKQSVAAFVAQIDPKADCRTGNRWLGVAVLDEPRSSRVGRAVLDGRELAVGTGPDPVAVAVCAAPSWLQLARMLTEARRIRDGVTDPVTGSRAPWIVAPACPSCRGATAPPYTWRVDRQGDLLVTAAVDHDACALPDPDLLSIGGLRLGSPERITWRPHDGEERGVAWSCATAAGLARGAGHASDPYADLTGVRGHDAAGSLEFRFVDPAPELLKVLSGGFGGAAAVRELAEVALDGRRLDAGLGQDIEGSDAVHAAMALVRTGAAAEPSSPARQSQLLRGGRTRPQLAPDLLRGWPNPFRDVISLGFRVPATIGEAFVWDDSDEQPTGLDLAAPVPWQQGAPEATVKIYTMSGQELVTLYSGATGTGETVLTWNGTDSFGRKMASGTYFCKLQLDEWSVTRRLVYVR